MEPCQRRLLPRWALCNAGRRRSALQRMHEPRSYHSAAERSGRVLEVVVSCRNGERPGVFADTRTRRRIAGGSLRRATMTNFQPDGWHTVTPRIIVPDPKNLVSFIKRVFRGRGEYRPGRPAEIRIGDSIIIVSDGGGIRESAPAFLYVDVEDVGEHVADCHAQARGFRWRNPLGLAHTDAADVASPRTEPLTSAAHSLHRYLLAARLP